MKTTACYVGENTYKVDDRVRANDQLVTIVEIQGPIIHFRPAVDLDATNSVTVESVEHE